MKRALLSVVLLAATVAQAESATLGQLLLAADQNNIDRQITLEQRKKAAADLSAAWGSLFPSITAQASWTVNQYPVEIALSPLPGAEPITITPKNQLDGIVRLELPLIDTQRWFRTSAAAAADEGAQYRDQAARDGVIMQVTATYYIYAASLGVREASKKSLAVAEAQAKLSEIRFSAGAITELDLVRARAEVQRNKQVVADSEQLVANTRRSLRTLTGIELDDSATLPPDELAQEGALADLEARFTESPAVKAAEADAKAADAFATASKLVLVPQVAGNFTERFTNATGFLGRGASYTAGVGLVWRLDLATIHNMRSQASQAQIAHLAAERQRLASRDRIHTDWQRLTSAIEKIGAAKAQVEASTRAAQIARDRYAAGAAAQFDVIQAERDLFSAEVNVIQARTELASSHVTLKVSAQLPLAIP